MGSREEERSGAHGPEVLGAPLSVHNQPRKAAPVICVQSGCKAEPAGYLICSGVANVHGRRGLADAHALTRLVGTAWGDASLVAATSTGVIGAPLPMDTIALGVQQIAQVISEEGSDDAAGPS